MNTKTGSRAVRIMSGSGKSLVVQLAALARPCDSMLIGKGALAQ